MPKRKTFEIMVHWQLVRTLVPSKQLVATPLHSYYLTLQCCQTKLNINIVLLQLCNLHWHRIINIALHLVKTRVLFLIVSLYLHMSGSCFSLCACMYLHVYVCIYRCVYLYDHVSLIMYGTVHSWLLTWDLQYDNISQRSEDKIQKNVIK